MAASVRLRVKLGGGLAALVGGPDMELSLSEPVPLRQVAQLAGVSAGAVMLYSVNGAVRSPEYVPADGDEVLLIPPVSGG